ncbi:hypothetical protein [Tautonia plasticadhaerens]|uniref:Uncharacterized protein n=1 Tax=Tautonia plasticadhaerens TaxID=2527974 RepID=A0A518H0V9_9BACT|nr:hypothetical protein [Tautonia plasticadhaerens]QDV34461.1 hypothetical protein ElP_23500 [Tautonia plasticadhaerens]
MVRRLTGPAAYVLLGGAVLACVASHRHRPESPGDVISRAARPCDLPGCVVCEAERARLRDAPWEEPGAIWDAIEVGRPLTVAQGDPDGPEPRPGGPGPPSP